MSDTYREAPTWRYVDPERGAEFEARNEDPVHPFFHYAGEPGKDRFFGERQRDGAFTWNVPGWFRRDERRAFRNATRHALRRFVNASYSRGASGAAEDAESLVLPHRLEFRDYYW